MPAARRYKQSLVDEIGEAIRSLPPGTPPEPEVSAPDALEQWKEDLRRKMFDEHVDISAIVDLLNSKGFKVNARQVRNTVKPKVKKPRQVSPAKTKGGTQPARRGREKPPTASPPIASKGSFTVQPDDEDC